MNLGYPNHMRFASIVGWPLVGLPLVCSLGCWLEPELPDDFGQCPVSDSDAPEPESPIERPTYHRDIRPILEGACTGCHAEGGIAPFSLTDYETVQTFGPLMLAAVDTGAMPPWPPSRCCAPLKHERSLSGEDRAVLARWLDDDAPEGDPADAPPPNDPPGLSRVDLEVMMPEPYTPWPSIGASDDSRCFLIDWPLDGSTFVTGLELVPGRRELVHHAIIYAIPESQASNYADKDAKTESPGWSCPGGVFESADAYVGSWVPGASVHDFPEGLGRKVASGSKILLNIHYELSAGAAPDQTSIRFKLEDSVSTEVEGLAVMNPLWLVGKTMRIPAGDSDVEHGYAYDPSTWTNWGKSITVRNVSLHMHEWGTRASLAVFRANGDVDCLLHIDEWNFDWQGEYWLEKPVTLHFGDRVYVECHFDNSESNQPDGGTPKDLWWGDDKEMCIASMLVSH